MALEIAEQAVSTHSRLKAAGTPKNKSQNRHTVSTHSRLKAAGYVRKKQKTETTVSTHSRLKAAGIALCIIDIIIDVSTHSRLKAAGLHNASNATFYRGFNTQPPEGGWGCFGLLFQMDRQFQHTAA